jgi:hypothetical protein
VTVSRRALRVVMASLMVAGVMNPATAARETCADFHGAVYLRNFAGGPPVNDVPSTFYSGVEGQSAVATVSPMPGCGDIDQSGPSTASYRTEDLTGSAGQDYTHVEGTTQPMCDDIDSWDQFCGGVPRSRPINLALSSDGAADSLSVETFRLRLTAGSRGISGGHPNPVPVYVIDANGTARASLEPGASTKVYTHIEAGRIRLPVFLAGTSPPSSVGFKIEGEGASPATAGTDFTCTPACSGGNGSLAIGSSRMEFVQVNFTRDEIVEGNERIRLSITSPAVATGEPASTVIEIDDLSTDKMPPVSRFIQPKNGVNYKWRDIRLREVRTSATDEGGPNIGKVEVAFQKKLTNGRCSWWTGTKFGTAGNNCGTKRWLAMKYRPTSDFYFVKIDPLPATIGTKIKNYSAWTRATDSAQNLETAFARWRNLITFEVRRKG